MDRKAIWTSVPILKEERGLCTKAGGWRECCWSRPFRRHSTELYWPGKQSGKTQGGDARKGRGGWEKRQENTWWQVGLPEASNTSFYGFKVRFYMSESFPSEQNMCTLVDFSPGHLGYD